MAQFEYEFSNQDKELVLTKDDSHVFGGTDYIRLTIYPAEAIDNIVTLANGEQAIFYSSLNEQPFEINVSPFGAGLDEFKTLELGVGGADNDFRIYKNDNDIYIKPNEIFNQFQLPQGDYRIQIDFLNQISKGQLYEQDLEVPYWFEDFDINGDEVITNLDTIQWNNVGRSDIGDICLQIAFGEIDEPPRNTPLEGEDPNPPQQGGGEGDVESNPVRGSEYFYAESSNVQYKFIIKQISTSRNWYFSI